METKEHKEYKVKVHLWKDKTKKVYYGIKVININELQCINCSSYIYKRTLNQKIACNLWMNEYFEIIK